MADQVNPYRESILQTLTMSCVSGQAISQGDIDEVGQQLVSLGPLNLELKDVSDKCLEVLEAQAEAAQKLNEPHLTPEVVIFEGGKNPVLIQVDSLNRMNDEEKAELGGGDHNPRSRGREGAFNENAEDAADPVAKNMSDMGVNDVSVVSNVSLDLEVTLENKSFGFS